MKKEKIVIIVLLIIQSIIYVYTGIKKSYIHIDEAYSLGLTHYDKIDIQDNEDFFYIWHMKDYYEEYLSVQEGEDYKPVYENQKNDVHPPLYYLLLRFAMEATKGHFSKWSGIILNIIIYGFVTIIMYLILKKLFKNDENPIIKTAFLTFLSSIILASVSNVINIRMYALSTLNVLIITLLHIKLLENSKTKTKLLVCIGCSILAGVLTHYYYLFYLASLFFIFFIKYIKEKDWKTLLYYTLTVIIAGLISLIIFPYSINHIFFGYRGQGVISNLENIYKIIPSILRQLYNLNYYGFNNLMPVIIISIILILIYNKIFKKEKIKISQKQREILKIIFIPSISFFIITSIASPWSVLRYIVPVCSLIFVITIYYLYKLLQTICKEKTSNVIISIVVCLILLAPVVLKMKPELMYDDRQEIIQELSKKFNLPTIYIYNSKSGGFLDDIFAFSIINESYIAKDLDCTENNIKNIFQNKDISKGIIILMNGDQDDNMVINKIQTILNFTENQFIGGLSSCKVYYLK